MAKSILHVLNAKIQNFIPIRFNRETNQYSIFYEEKTYSIHKLIIKVQKNLNIINENTDINVNKYSRLSIKFNTELTRLMLRPDTELSKTISMRIVKSKYTDLQLKYVNFLQIYEKLTWVGAEVKLIPIISECQTVVKDSTICYKIISTQKANTHWMNTIAVIKKSQEPIKIGKLKIITSRMNMYEKDIYA